MSGNLFEIARRYWTEHNDDFCGTILDDRYADYVSANFPEYAHNTPGVEFGPPDGSDEWHNKVMEASSGVGAAFVLYLAKRADPQWLIEQLTKYLQEQQDEGSRAGGEQS